MIDLNDLKRIALENAEKRQKQDEEIAEEWCKENMDCIKTVSFLNHDCNYFSDEARSVAKSAFLAGLKAGKPRWYKITDGDLPKENNLYLVAIKDNGLAIAYFNGLHWETKFNLGDFGHCLETVIAWCEIPKFEEK